MPRKRTIDPDIWTDAKIQSLPHVGAVVLYIGSISIADDYGRFEFSARQLWARIFPAREDVRIEDVQEWMQALEHIGLVSVYTVNDRKYAEHPAWSNHQYVSRPSATRIPAPPTKKPPGGSDRQRDVAARQREIAIAAPRAAQPENTDAAEESPAMHLSPALSFARWFIREAVATGALPPDRGLDLAAEAHRQMAYVDDANALLQAYGRDEVEVRARRFFALRLANGFRREVNIRNFRAAWDWQAVANAVPAQGAARRTASSKFAEASNEQLAYAAEYERELSNG